MAGRLRLSGLRQFQCCCPEEPPTPSGMPRLWSPNFDHRGHDYHEQDGIPISSSTIDVNPVGDFGLIHFDDAFETLAMRVNHGSSQFLSQQPSCLVCGPELVLKLSRRRQCQTGRDAAHRRPRVLSRTIWGISPRSPCRRLHGGQILSRNRNFQLLV